MSLKEELIDYWKDRNIKNYQKKISSNDFLLRNSVELVNILKNLNLVNKDWTYLEIGCGSGRNLDFLLKENNEINKVYGNDLIKDECFKYMSDNVKEHINFSEKDSLSFLEENFLEVDLLIASDHLMHIDKDSVQEILRILSTEWKPKYICLRETLAERLTTKPFKYIHNFDILNNNYDVVYNQNSVEDSTYYIKIYKLRN